MFKSERVATLAGSLATIAIAGLGGPLAALGATAAEAVKFAQSTYMRSAGTRDLNRAVTETIRTWAEAEQLEGRVVQLGLTLATDILHTFAADWETAARLQFEPKRITDEVVRRASASDKFWGQEAHYAVAERALKVTYQSLMEQVQQREGAVLEAISASRQQIEVRLRALESTAAAGSRSLQAIENALVDGSTAADFIVFLHARIADWDVASWLPGKPAPSVLERRLTAREGAVDFAADEALEGQHMLVVLGAPGSGKTWLAKRYARKAAEIALAALEKGVDLADIEVPLYTTWDLWTQAAKTAPTRRALIDASFASVTGHSDLGGQDVVERLRRTLEASRQRVIAVVDSLDEAAAHDSQTTLLSALVSVADWRLVVTSRTGAWESESSTVDKSGARVVTLQELDYPGDVEKFLNIWFQKAPDRGQALKIQISRSPALRRISVSPLLLTFLCLLTDKAADPRDPLPRNRLGLYRAIISLLLEGDWANRPPGDDNAPDVEECSQLLAHWAWDAAGSRSNAAGIGTWLDKFVAPRIPRHLTDHEKRALDNIAPRVGTHRGARGYRRFVHRTLLENLVAEHVGALSPYEAEATLVPHLWFDPD